MSVRAALGSLLFPFLHHITSHRENGSRPPAPLYQRNTLKVLHYLSRTESTSLGSANAKNRRVKQYKPCALAPIISQVYDHSQGQCHVNVITFSVHHNILLSSDIIFCSAAFSTNREAVSLSLMSLSVSDMCYQTSLHLC